MFQFQQKKNFEALKMAIKCISYKISITNHKYITNNASTTHVSSIRF